MHVGLVVDNPKRDLHGCVLVAWQLLQRGQARQVSLIPLYSQGYEIPLLDLDWVVFNYARKVNQEIFLTCKQLGIQTAVVDTEGGVLSRSGLDSPENWAKDIKSSGFTELIDLYTFWGEEVHSQFLKHSGLNRSQLRVTGCPRYDFCADPWQEIWASSKDGYVLINTNFSAINPLFTRSEESEIKIFESLGWEKEYIKEVIHEQKEIHPQYIGAIQQVADQLPNQSFLVRPHPFENAEVYERAFTTRPNVVVDGSGNVFSAIKGCKLMLHLNCGSAIDSVLMGKLPVCLEFLNTEAQKSHTPLPREISVLANGIQDLVEVIRGFSPDKVGSLIRQMEEKITPWFFKNDGLNGVRVADALTELHQKRQEKRLSTTAAVSGSRRKNSTLQLLQGILFLTVGSRATVTLRNQLQPFRKAKFFDDTTVNQIIIRLNEIGNGQHAITLGHQRIGPLRHGANSVTLVRS